MLSQKTLYFEWSSGIVGGSRSGQLESFIILMNLQNPELYVLVRGRMQPVSLHGLILCDSSVMYDE